MGRKEKLFVRNISENLLGLIRLILCVVISWWLTGILGASTALVVSLNGKLPIVMVQLCLVGIAGAVAIADVTIDACIARNSIEWFLLAPDMQSLCGYVSSVGALIGYLSSGVFVHRLGAQVCDLRSQWIIDYTELLMYFWCIMRVMSYVCLLQGALRMMAIPPASFVLLGLLYSNWEQNTFLGRKRFV